MTWTANLDSMSRNADGRVQLAVTYTNGTASVQRTYVADGNVSADWLKRTALREIAALDSLVQLQSALALGPIDLTPPVEPGAPSDAASLWFAEHNKLRAMEYAAERGLLPPTHRDLQAQRVRVKATFQPEFAHDARMPRG
jgi:hypothetical protein